MTDNSSIKKNEIHIGNVGVDVIGVGVSGSGNISGKNIDISGASFELALEVGDITTFPSDVMVLKYAQQFYGVDRVVSNILEEEGVLSESITPRPGKYCFIENPQSFNSSILFVGVVKGRNFRYKEVRDFARDAIGIVSKESARTKHLSMTIHGVGFGLDEVESFYAQFAGLVEGLSSNLGNNTIRRITIIDRNLSRMNNLRKAFDKRLTSLTYVSRLKDDGSLFKIDITRPRRIIYGNAIETSIPDLPYSVTSAGSESDLKPHVFVAMPFSPDMEDVFYLGIQEPARNAEFLCERTDNETFTGDILEQVKMKIETASVVIADLTGANPNVYLEIGYAWGKERPTILLVKDEDDVRFDVRGQKHLKYKSIMSLRNALENELIQLKSKGLI